ncbi:MAG: tyrosine--tRNA ligase, partial [Treponemataceae bacterium]|nr:tyrosine--tRNA ligase [Treponemataceae bacterium]
DVLVENKIASSKREAREFLKANAISINGKIETDENFTIGKEIALGGELVIIRRGKKKYFVVNV